MKRYINSQTISASLLALVTIVLAVTGYAIPANADIYNPHPVPPSNSVTAAMLTAGSVTPVKIAKGQSFSFTGGSPYSVIADGIEATSSFQAPASTTFNGVHYAWPSSDGTNNYVLTTNGSGTITWKSPASGKLSQNFVAGEGITVGSAVAMGDGLTGSLVSVGGTATSFAANHTPYYYSQMVTTPSVAATITQITVYASDTSTKDASFTVSIYTCNVSNQPTGTALYSQHTVAAYPSAAGTYTVTLATPLDISASTDYCLVISDNNTQDSVHFYSNNSTGTNTFVSTDGGSTWSAQNGALYMSVVGGITTIGDIYNANASSNTSYRFTNYIGIAEATASVGSTTAVDIEGISTALSGLTSGSTYYLGNTDGAISTTAGTNSKKIGRALTPSLFDVVQPPL